MFASKLQIRLPRRITAYFLLFGLAALVWLSVGAVYVAYTVTDSRSESASLRSLGRGSDRIVLAYLRDKSADLQAGACGNSRTKRRRLLRHRFADRRVPGPHQPRAARQASDRKRHDDAIAGARSTRVEYRDRRRRADSRVSLPAQGRRQGSWAACDWALRSRACGATFAQASQFAPLAFLGPACCMVGGVGAAQSSGAAGGRYRTATASSGDEPFAGKLRVARSSERRRGGDRLESRRSAASSPAASRNRCSNGFANRSTKAGKADSTRCSTAFRTAWRRPTRPAG